MAPMRLPIAAPNTTKYRDRKSTRLNSSHLGISYAVFCLKKKKKTSEFQSLRHLVCLLLLEKKTSNLQKCECMTHVMICLCHHRQSLDAADLCKMNLRCQY